MVWYMVYGMVWYGMVYGTVRYSTVWYGMVWYGTLYLNTLTPIDCFQEGRFFVSRSGSSGEANLEKGASCRLEWQIHLNKPSQSDDLVPGDPDREAVVPKTSMTRKLSRIAGRRLCSKVFQLKQRPVQVKLLMDKYNSHSISKQHGRSFSLFLAK